MKSIQELFSQSKTAFRRFPITLLWTIVGSLYFILQEWGVVDHDPEGIAVFTLGVSWFLSIRFLVESFPKWSTIKKGVVFILMLFLLGFYYYYLIIINNDVVTTNRWGLYILGGHIFLFFSPFLTRWDKTAFWNYLRSIIIAILKSALFSGILFLGLMGLILATNTFILDRAIDANDILNIIVSIGIVCFGVINTFIYCYDFPKKVQENTTAQLKKPLKVLVQYILIPLLILYLLVLYIYSLKILISWELPEGGISIMIVVSFIVGLIIHFIIAPFVKEQSSRLIHLFYPWFYIISLPLFFLLFVAVFRRINDYGITEFRYELLLVALWLVLMFIFILLKKGKKLIFIPISLFFIIIVFSLGPWGVFSVSVRSQVNQFKTLFAKRDMIAHTITDEQDDRLRSIFYYLGRRNQLTQLNPIVGLDVDSIASNSWYDGWHKVRDSLKLTVDFSKTPYSNTKIHYFDYGNYHRAISGIGKYSTFTRPVRKNGIDFSDSRASLSWGVQGDFLQIYRGDSSLLLQFKWIPTLKKWAKKEVENSQLDPNNFVFTFHHENGDFMVIIQEISGRLNKNTVEGVEIKDFYIDKLKLDLFYSKPYQSDSLKSGSLVNDTMK